MTAPLTVPLTTGDVLDFLALWFGPDDISPLARTFVCPSLNDAQVVIAWRDYAGAMKRLEAIAAGGEPGDWTEARQVADRCRDWWMTGVAR